MPKKTSLDEILSKRSGNVISTERGDVLTRVAGKAPASWSDTDRSARFIMSTQEEDRYGDIVVIDGIDMTNFLENPVAPFSHRSSGTFPIGTWQDLKKINGRPKRLEGSLKFADEGDYDQADIAARLVSKGVLRAVSIGFIPGDDVEDIRDDNGHWMGWQFNESELVECSLVQIPANPSAIIKSAGDDVRLCRELLETVLDEYAKTPDGLIVPRSEYEQRYREVADTKSISQLPDLRDIFDAQEETTEVDSLSVEIDTKEAEKKLRGLAAIVDDMTSKIASIVGFTHKNVPDTHDDEPEFVEGALEKAQALKEKISAEVEGTA